MPIVLLTRESHGYKFIPFFQSLSVYINKKYMLFYWTLKEACVIKT